MKILNTEEEEYYGFVDYAKLLLPYSGKFSEGKIFGNFGKNDFQKYIS